MSKERERNGADGSDRSGSDGKIVTIEGLAAPVGATDARNDAPDDAPDDSTAILALRERAATSLERGLGFVTDYGDAFALKRAHLTLEVSSQADCVQALAARQREDGAFDPIGFVFSGQVVSELREAQAPPLLLGTLEALSVLADLRALSSGCAERALEYLTRAQRADGSFGYGDPEAERGGSSEAAAEEAVRNRLFLTGMLGGYAARTPYVRPEVLSFAADFLRPLFSPDRIESGGLSTIAAFAHFYANGGDREHSDEALQWCGRELERGFRTRRFEASQTLRVLLYCDSTALPGATFDTVELLDRLLEEQSGDGGFAPLDPGGPPGRVAPTLDSLIAIRGLCQGI